MIYLFNIKQKIEVEHFNNLIILESPEWKHFLLQQSYKCFTLRANTTHFPLLPFHCHLLEIITLIFNVWVFKHELVCLFVWLP